MQLLSIRLSITVDPIVNMLLLLDVVVVVVVVEVIRLDISSDVKQC